MDHRLHHTRLYNRGVKRKYTPHYIKYGKASLTPKEHVLALRLRMHYEKDPAVRNIIGNELSIAVAGSRLNVLQKRNIVQKRERRSYVWKEGRRSYRGPNNPFWRHSHSEETLKFLSDARQGELNPMYGRQQPESMKRSVSAELKGVLKTEEHRRNMSRNWNKRRRVRCHACGTITTMAMHVRWHGNNCRRAMAADWS